MKFDEKYPSALPNIEHNFEGSTVFKVKGSGECAVCHTQTSWCDLSFECFVCSEECDRKMWNGYFKALKDSNDEPNTGIQDAIPCPFCGKNNLRYTSLIINVWIVCDTKGCGCGGPIASSRAEALKLWNTRVMPWGDDGTTTESVG